MERSNQIKANVERALAKTSVTVAPKDGKAPILAQPEKETTATEDADVADAFADAMGQAVEAPIQTIEREYIITGTDEMLKRLEAFMNGNGIKFKLG